MVYVKGVRREIILKTVIDMKGEDVYLNKQGSTSTKMDTHTHVTLNHLQAKNQFGNEKDKGKRFFQMLRELENSYYV